jgi:hypothetical protein
MIDRRSLGTGTKVLNTGISHEQKQNWPQPQQAQLTEVASPYGPPDMTLFLE